MQDNTHSLEIWKDKDAECINVRFRNFSESVIEKTAEATNDIKTIWGSNICSFINSDYSTQIIDMTITMATAIVLEQFRIVEEIVSSQNESYVYPDYEDVEEDFRNYIFDTTGQICQKMQNQLSDNLNKEAFQNGWPFELDPSLWLNPDSDSLQTCLEMFIEAAQDYENQIEAYTVLTVKDLGDHFEILDGNHDAVDMKSSGDERIWFLSGKENELLSQFRTISEKTEVQHVSLGKMSDYSEVFRKLLREILGSNTSIFYQIGKQIIKDEPEIIPVNMMS